MKQTVYILLLLLIIQNINSTKTTSKVVRSETVMDIMNGAFDENSLEGKPAKKAAKKKPVSKQ